MNDTARVLLKRDLQAIWPDCSSYYLNVSQKAQAKNELLIGIIWIARRGSTCLLEGFVHSFTLAGMAALNGASLFFFYFYPLAVNNNNDFMPVTEFPANSKNKVPSRGRRLPPGHTSLPEI